MALPADGHIIGELEEDYHGRENKTELEGKYILGKRMKRAAAFRGESVAAKEKKNMFGKCSTTCLQFIINFLEPSQSYGSEARASGAVLFSLADVTLLCFIMCLFRCFLSAQRA